MAQNFGVPLNLEFREFVKRKAFTQATKATKTGAVELIRLFWTYLVTVKSAVAGTLFSAERSECEPQWGALVGVEELNVFQEFMTSQSRDPEKRWSNVYHKFVFKASVQSKKRKTAQERLAAEGTLKKYATIETIEQEFGAKVKLESLVARMHAHKRQRVESTSSSSSSSSEEEESNQCDRLLEHGFCKYY